MSRGPSRWYATTLVCVSLFAFLGCERFSSLGERIFFEGRGEHGRITYSQGPNWLARGEFGCATCHGADGSGRFVRAGNAQGSAPAITAEELAARGYDQKGLRRALFEGFTPEGRVLNDYMPRWLMTDREFTALAEFLAEL